jgi:16S rRNA C1402 N4-methylase RsmH
MVSLQRGGAEWEGVLPKVRAVTRKAVAAGKEELDLNPRARSAKLRVIEKEQD